MANYDTVRTGVGRLAGKAVKSTETAAGLTVLYVRQKAAEAKLDGYYTALGKLTFKQLESGESQAEKIAPILDGIRETREKIRLLRKKIAVERAKRKTTDTQIIIETAIENATSDIPEQE